MPITSKKKIITITIKIKKQIKKYEPSIYFYLFS